jgi:hypothetical protein
MKALNHRGCDNCRKRLRTERQQAFGSAKNVLASCLVVKSSVGDPDPDLFAGSGSKNFDRIRIPDPDPTPLKVLIINQKR